MFDKDDAHLLAKGGVLFAMFASMLLSVAAVLGFAWRVRTFAAGG